MERLDFQNDYFVVVPFFFFLRFFELLGQKLESLRAQNSTVGITLYSMDEWAKPHRTAVPTP